MAGTTPVIIREEAALSSKGIGGNCALLTDEIQTSSTSLVTNNSITQKKKTKFEEQPSRVSPMLIPFTSMIHGLCNSKEKMFVYVIFKFLEILF